MHVEHFHKDSFFKKVLLVIISIILVFTAAPITPVLADSEPDSLPIYVGWQQFAHTGSTANVSNDATRVLNFPIIPGRNNNATTAGGRLRVVPVTNGSSGIVVRTNKIKLEGGFSTYFVMHLNGSTSLNNTGFPGPADGLTFIIQDNPTPVLGGVGEGVGYAGIPNSVGVEFDTWKNLGPHLGIQYNDPNLPYSLSNRYHPVTNPNGPTADHVAIVMNGNNNHPQGSGDVIDNLQGANFRLYDYGSRNDYVHVWVDYDQNGLLTTTYGLSDNRANANNRSISRNVGMSLMNKEVYVGFGASTGGANSHHDILAWYFKNSYVVGGLKPDGNYKQGPSAVTIKKIVSTDVGAQTGIDIKVNGISSSDNLPNEKVDIYVNNQLITGEYSTNSEGVLVYTFNDSSNLQVGNNIITVVTRNGGTSAQTTVVKTAAPVANNIVLAYTTKGIVTIDGVPNGVAVTLYDDNHEVIATSPVATNGKVRFNLTDASKDILANASQIDISYAKNGEAASNLTAVTPIVRSSAPEEVNIVTNVPKNTVTVKDVPPGSTVKVYGDDDELIGTATNNGDEEADVVVTIELPTKLQEGDLIEVTITEEDGKTESERVTSKAKLESDTLVEESIITNATKNTVTVKDVPPGATINVYDKNGDVIGTATNPGSIGDIVVEINSPHTLEAGDIIKVTVTETGKLESNPLSSEAKLDSVLDTNNVKTNATNNTVTVKDVPPGATINVYDKNGDVIGTATNTGSTKTAVVVTIESIPELTEGDIVKVTVTENGHLESEPVVSEAKTESSLLDTDNVETNATKNTVTVKDVPPGATINVYDKNGDVIGKVTNTGPSITTVVVNIEAPHVLNEGDLIKVGVTETGKLESPSISSQAKSESNSLENSTVKPSVTTGSVKVVEVPAGATIIVYDENGTELKRAVNTGAETGAVVIEGLDLEPGTKIQVTITEEGRYESKPLLITVEFTTDEAINDALRALQIGYQANDTWESVTLPVLIVTTGANETTVEWASNKPNAIEISLPENGTVKTLVHRHAKDESVILTASVSKNGVTKTRTFLLIVKAENLTKTTIENYRQVRVVGGSDDEVNEQVGINRVMLSNGVKIDKAIFDSATATRFVNDLRTKNGVSTVYINEVPGDEPGEIAVEIPGQSVRLLNNNQNTLDIRTEYATLSIPADTLTQMADRYLDLFFRLIPVKDAGHQTELNASIVNDTVVRTAAGGRNVEVIGSSLEIETNYRDYTTTLFLPFAKNGIIVPASNFDSFLNSLRVFVEHSDGEKVVMNPTVVYNGITPIGLEIKIDKFSIFSVIQLTERSTGGSTVLPVQPVTEQVKKTTFDPKAGTIVLDLVDGSGKVDTSGFIVKVSGKAVEIQEVKVNGSQVVIQLKNPIPAGYEATVSYTPGSGFTGTLKSFTDLNIANPAHHIAYIKGFPDGTFRPNNTITRAEMSALLARNKNLSNVYEYQKLYPDVAKGFWAAANIEQLQDIGLMIGDKQGNFRPSDRITRAEMAMIAAKWLNADLDAPFTNTFEDVSDQHWAAAAIAAVNKAGVMIGFEDGSFGLREYVTRAQAVTIMNRLLGRGPLTGVTKPTWPDATSAHWAYEHIEEASQDHYYTYLPDGKELLFKQ
ncbi:S-layer homology domain-containing protein [Paenibacillus luteus]|uniref:S-layer homology domain-containing protein n=1 Tax=Paenibacillus luteus TaxID=2545753 RepID=UPI001144C35A|nr:S-layer homology domain-containing protein [Paenibacillus luteus]